MDSGTLSYLQGVLPDRVLELLDEHILRPDSPVQELTGVISGQIREQLSWAAGLARTGAQPLADHLNAAGWLASAASVISAGSAAYAGSATAGSTRPTATPEAGAAATAAGLGTVAKGIVMPLLDRLVQAAYDAPDLVVVGLVAAMLVLSLQVLMWMRRLVAWWTRLVLRLVFWSGMAVLVAAVWKRGLEQTAQDAASLVGRLVGSGAFVRDIWRSEYQRYQQQQLQAQAANGGQAYHGGRGGMRSGR